MNSRSLVLLPVLLLAVVLRIHATVALPLEQDELYTIAESTELFDTRIEPGIQARPLFFLVMHPVVRALPHTPEILRALPLLFGIAGVVATWFLARAVFGQTAAVVATLLVALSPWHLAASSFSRYYSLLFLLATVVYLYLPRAYDGDRPRDYLVTLAAMLAGAFTHPSFVFPVAGASLAAMAFDGRGKWSWRWPSRNGWRYLWVPFVVLSALAALILTTVSNSANVGNRGGRGLLATLRLLPAIVDLVSPVICTAAVAGMLLAIAARTRGEIPEAGRARQFAIMAAAGTFATAGALVALSFVTGIYSDYAIAALPLVLVSAGGLAQWVASAVQPRAAALGAGSVTLVMLAGMLPSTVSFLSDGGRFDYRPAYARIAEDDPDRTVVTWPIALQRRYAPQLRGYELPRDVTRLDELLTNEGDLWLVSSVKRYGIALDDSGSLMNWLSENCRLVDQYQKPRFDYRMNRVDLWRCRR